MLKKVSALSNIWPALYVQIISRCPNDRTTPHMYEMREFVRVTVYGLWEMKLLLSHKLCPILMY